MLCPGPVPTRIHDAERNRPAALAAATAAGKALPKPDFGLVLERATPETVATKVLAAIEENRELVLPTDDIVPMARSRAEHLLATL